MARSRVDAPCRELEFVFFSLFCEVAKGATSQNREMDERQNGSDADRAGEEFGFIQVFRFCEVAFLQLCKIGRSATARRAMAPLATQTRLGRRCSNRSENPPNSRMSATTFAGRCSRGRGR